MTRLLAFMVAALAMGPNACIGCGHLVAVWQPRYFRRCDRAKLISWVNDGQNG